MLRLKNHREIKLLREGGNRLAQIMSELTKEVKPGVSAASLDKLSHSLILNYGGKPSFLNYKPDFANHAFPASICVSLNETIVHGIPKKEMIFFEGDIVSLDLGLCFRGLYTDMAITVGVGKIKPILKKLIKVTKGALGEAIKVSKPGNTLGDIGYAIETYVLKNGFYIIKDLSGHGVGYKCHEEPPVFNYGNQKEGLILQPGMVLAIEPMVAIGCSEIKEKEDGSFITACNQPAAHFENTIAITKNKPIVLTSIL